MMKVSTPRGDQVRDYYLALEDLFKLYIQYQSELRMKQNMEEKELALVVFREELIAKDSMIADKDKQLLIEQNKNLSIQNFIDNVQLLDREEYIYIATTAHYARNNTFKVGGTKKDLVCRLSSYNCGRADGDNFYYCWINKCHDYLPIENRIKSLLSNWRSNKLKEMYILNYNFLVKFIEFICHNNDSEIEIVNNFISTEYVNAIVMEPIIPLPILEFNNIIFRAPLRAAICAGTVINDNPAIDNIEPAQVQLIENIIDPDNEIILTVQLSRRDVKRLIKIALQQCAKDGVVKLKDLNNVLKSSLGRGKKTKFKVREWSPMYSEIAATINIRIER